LIETVADRERGNAEAEDSFVAAVPGVADVD
jgi:hypothetical protein